MVVSIKPSDTICIHFDTAVLSSHDLQEGGITGYLGGVEPYSPVSPNESDSSTTTLSDVVRYHCPTYTFASH